MTDYKKELEEFTYIVSHDLNAPFRHIKAFSKILVENLGDKVSNEDRECLEYLEGSVVRAENMLSALLEYSSLSSQAKEHTTFDCHELVESIATGLAPKDAHITLSGLPTTLHADEKQIHQLFFQLLDNALKFRREDAPPHIEIKAEQQNDIWLFSVEDNGIGITEAQHQNVFTMFRRLNPSNGLPGTGAGLTIVKKIIDMHNGKVWIENAPSSGTILLFELPRD